MAVQLIRLTEKEEKAGQAAADYLDSDKGVKVDAAAVKRHCETLLEFKLTHGFNANSFADAFGRAGKNAKGKPIASSNMRNRWRLAEYLHATTGHALYDRVKEACGMTADAARKQCTALKPLLVEAGLVTDRGRKEETHAVASAKAVHKAVKRFKEWASTGIKATTRQPARPAFNAEHLFGLAWGGAAPEKLTQEYRTEGTNVDAPSTPRPVRSRKARPTVAEQAA